VLDLLDHVYNWLVSFFTGHSHCTNCNGIKSTFEIVTAYHPGIWNWTSICRRECIRFETVECGKCYLQVRRCHLYHNRCFSYKYHTRELDIIETRALNNSLKLRPNRTKTMDFEVSTSNPRRLWNTVDELLGRCRVRHLQPSASKRSSSSSSTTWPRWSRVGYSGRRAAYVQSRAAWRPSTELHCAQCADVQRRRQCCALATRQVRLAVDMKLFIHIHIHIHRYPSCIHVRLCSEYLQSADGYYTLCLRKKRAVELFTITIRVLHNNNSEEDRTRWYGRLFLSANFQFDGLIQTLGTPRCTPVDEVPVFLRSLTILAVRISARTLYWNCGVAGTLWHTASCRSWRGVCPRPTGHDGRVWHCQKCQSFGFVAAAAVKFVICDTAHR